MKRWIRMTMRNPFISFKRHHAKVLSLMLCLFVIGATCIGQNSRKVLEDRRKKLLKEIDQTSSLLSQTKQNRDATYSTFLTLQRQISKRQQLIQTLQSEVKQLAESVSRSTSVVEALTEDVERLKEEYANMARHAYRQRLTHTDWLFLLSAQSFNDAFQRWQYLKQYDRYRQKQANLILETQKTLISKINALEQRKAEKGHLLSSEQRQAEMLGLELSSKDRLLVELRSDESRLGKELAAKKTSEANLAAAIENIIREEIEKARREADRSAGAGANRPAASAASSEPASMSREFQSNKGKLPWPVGNGVITGTFGKQQHPVFRNVQITNNGVDIRTDIGSSVKAVFEGAVVGTQFIPGFDYMVILQHGEFYTVYSNLDEVKVSKGDKVKIRQEIGKVSTDWKTNTSELHFEVWKEKTRLNPADWIGGR